MSEKNLRKLKKVFYALTVVFILILLTIFMTPIMVGSLIRAIFLPLIFFFWILFFLLGAILIFLTLKSKVKGKLKVFLLLAGGSSAGFLISVILHNAIYGLVGIEEPVFFIIAVFLCPIGFLIGAIGSIILLKRKGGRHSSHR